MNLLRELSMGEIVSRLAAVLIYAGLQGFLLAATARLFGDKRPQHEERLTPNPFMHLSAWGAFVGALFEMSWIRGTWYDANLNRLGRWGVAIVPFLALAAMAVVVLCSDALRPLLLMLPRTGGYAALYVLDQFQAMSWASILLNLIPMPGLVAGDLWQAVWPANERRLRSIEKFSLAFIIVAVVAGWLPNLATLLR